MALTWQRTLTAKLADGTDLNQVAFERDTSYQSLTFQKVHSSVLSLTDTINTTVTLPAGKTGLLFIEATADLNVTIDGGNQPLQLRPQVSETAMVMVENSSTTSIVVAQPAAGTCTVYVTAASR